MVYFTPNFLKRIWQNIMEQTLFHSFILILFVSSSYILHVNGAESSKFSCKKHYFKGELHVDCSYQNFFIIPKLPANTVHLNLQHNYIYFIPNKAFGNMRNLRVLDLSFNDLHSIKEKSFKGLRKLKQLILNNNHLKYSTRTFPRGSFKPLKSLKMLLVQNNNEKASGVKTIFPAKTIAHLTKLEILALDIKSFLPNTPFFGTEYAKLLNLHSVHLYMNDFFYLSDYTFKYIPKLTHLYIFHIQSNYLRHLAFSTLKMLKFLQIDFTDKVRQVMTYAKILELILELSQTSITILIMQNVRLLPYSTGGCIRESLNAVLNETSISQLHLSKVYGLNLNCVRSQTTIKAPPRLQILNLTSNDLSWIALDLNTVVSLNLKHNNLGNYLSNSRYITTQTSIIENICLSYNSIYQLKKQIFKGQPYLKIIDLSFNFLSQISFDLFHLEELQILNLSNNRIKFLNEQSMNNIDELLNKNNNTQIDLRDNPLQCTCYTVPFLKWILQIPHHFIKYSKYHCTYENGTISKANSFAKVTIYLEQACIKEQHWNDSLLFTVFGVVAAIILVLAVFIYRQRWKLGYLYYKAKIKYFSSKSKEVDENEYTYDAFISYADENRMFVKDTCIQNLEQDRNLKLCIHERDFIPGHDIMNNIINAIQTSRKTICIITRSFLKSEFCMFEFKMALMESIHSRNGKNVLLLVFNDQLSAKELPLILYEYIQKQSYIQYPNNTIDNAIFWGKINDAIYA